MRDLRSRISRVSWLAAGIEVLRSPIYVHNVLSLAYVHLLKDVRVMVLPGIVSSCAMLSATSDVYRLGTAIRLCCVKSTTS